MLVEEGPQICLNENDYINLDIVSSEMQLAL